MTEIRHIDEIIVGPRFRKDLGDVEEMAREIRAAGHLVHPVAITPDGRLIAGERRLLACKSLGWTEIPVTIIDVTDERTLIRLEASENLTRKDFTLSEAVAIKRALEPELREEAEARKRAGTLVQTLHKGKTRAKVARFTGFSHETLRKAEVIVAAAEAEPERFEKLQAEMDRTGRVDAPFKQLNVARARDAYQGRKQTAAECVADLEALAASGYRASVILADPPWPFETWGERGKIWTSVDNHYDPMPLEEIKALPVGALAADDCVLFLWVTWPLLVLGHPLDVIRAWGFEPKTLGFDWIKTNPSGEGVHWGAGYYTRSNAEPCLVATRGSPQRMATDVHQIIMAPIGEHSEKPDETHGRIERLFNGPYLELFARKQRPGWHVWGDEVSKAAAE